jgi:hypothetical protein
MVSVLGSLGLAYLAGSGMTTNAAVVGRGLFRAVRTAVAGEYKMAAVEGLAALASPALMSYGSIASLCMEVADAASELAAPALEEALERRAFGRAA